MVDRTPRPETFVPPGYRYDHKASFRYIFFFLHFRGQKFHAPKKMFNACFKICIFTVARSDPLVRPLQRHGNLGGVSLAVTANSSVKGRTSPLLNYWLLRLRKSHLNSHSAPGAVTVKESPSRGGLSLTVTAPGALWEFRWDFLSRNSQ